MTLVYTGPHAYGYDLALTFPNETVSSWTVHDENALLTALADAYGNDASISFVINSHEDVNGALVITVMVLGFPTLSSVTASYEAVSASGLDFTSEEYDFRGVSSSASAPAMACNIGFSAGTDDVCSDTDGCIDNTCGDGDCVDAVAPAVGYSCDCDVGWYDNSGTCTDVDACDVSSETCGDNGDCVDFVAPGTGFTCDCDAGYVLTDTAQSGCTIVSCGSPATATGYTINSGGTTYGSTRAVTCAAGYIGTAVALTCQASGAWTSVSGCSLITCASSPTQAGYTIATGASTVGSTRTTACLVSGRVGSSITCGSNGQWGVATGCSLDVEYLVIAGGGSGGPYAAGAGGGAGGYRSSVAGESSGGGAPAETPLSVTFGTTYTVTVGVGGPGRTLWSADSSSAHNGRNSVFGSVTSVGGARGGHGWSYETGGVGGSGGGGAGWDGISNVGTAAGGTATTGQGYGGGLGRGISQNKGAGGGGGGAGGRGQDATSTTGGNGGVGLASSITGSSVYRAGGGGGACYNPYHYGTGGNGGGGSCGSAGAANTGGGGSAPTYYNSDGLAGGSGVVFLKYSPSYTITVVFMYCMYCMYCIYVLYVLYVLYLCMNVYMYVCM